VKPAVTALLAAALAPLYAAPAGCAACHPAQTARFTQAGMTRALEPASSSALLQSNPALAVQLGPYSYRIDHGTYTVSDGKETLRIPLEWAFGQGSAGQTYVYRYQGAWYESRVSFYSALHGLDLTIGMQDLRPRNLVEAAGRLAGTAEIGSCFDCHATGVVRLPRADLSHMVAGIQCERCHGVSEAHLRTRAPMRKLGSLTSEEMSDFCGQCHRTWSQIAANGPRGILNVRFQPYRLGISKCFDAADARIRCTACHDPHAPVATAPAAYDSKCLACHASKPCRTGATRDCAGCHMPKLELPGAHKKFTDHKIRVVKAHEPYPD